MTSAGSRFDGYSDYLDQAKSSWHCPGLSVAIAVGDELVFEHSTGLGRIEDQVPLSKDSVFPIASCTKSFTAMSIALLVDSGRLGWDEPLRVHLPELILDDAYATEHVTVRDLLCHRTGMPRHEIAVMRLDISRWEMLRRLSALKFSASFREKYQYCNPIYCVLPCLVERLTDEPWEAFVQEKVLDPLGMTESAIGPHGLLNNSRLINGYRTEFGKEGAFEGHVNIGFGRFTDLWPGGSGGMVSSVRDLMKWVRFHATDGNSQSPQIISAKTKNEMYKPQIPLPEIPGLASLSDSPLRFAALGWEVQPYRGRTLISHAGALGGSSLMMGFIPESNASVVIASNLRHTPIGGALMFESFDRALGLSSMNWSERFLEHFSPNFEATAKERAKDRSSRVKKAPYTHVLEDYVGRFCAPGYPDLAVRISDGRLEARFDDSTDWAPLAHWHYDVFEWQLDNWGIFTKLQFLSDPEGQISSVAIPVEPSVKDIAFIRASSSKASPLKIRQKEHTSNA